MSFFASNPFGSLDAIKAAVQEGVKELSQVSHAALAEVRQNAAQVGHIDLLDERRAVRTKQRLQQGAEGERVVIDGVAFNVPRSSENGGADAEDSERSKESAGASSSFRAGGLSGKADSRSTATMQPPAHPALLGSAAHYRVAVKAPEAVSDVEDSTAGSHSTLGSTGLHSAVLSAMPGSTSSLNACSSEVMGDRVSPASDRQSRSSGAGQMPSDSNGPSPVDLKSYHSAREDNVSSSRPVSNPPAQSGQVVPPLGLLLPAKGSDGVPPANSSLHHAVCESSSHKDSHQDEPYVLNTRSNSSHSLASGSLALATGARVAPVVTATAAEASRAQSAASGDTTAAATSNSALLPRAIVSSISNDIGSNDDIRRAYYDTKRAYDELKGMLHKSMAECMRLSDDVVRLESQSRQQHAAATESANAARLAKRDADDATAALAAAKRETAVAVKSAAKAQAALQAQQEAQAKDGGMAELQQLQEQLAATVRKAAAAVDAREAAEARAAAAEAARASAEAARLEADRLRRDAQAEAHAAQAVAEAERSNRAEAQGMSETLRQEGERRARVFNNAVKAAVSKVQRELEQQRDELAGQLREALALVEKSKAELHAAIQSADEAHEEAAARTADAAAAGNLAVIAEGAAERSRVREQEAMTAAHAAEVACVQAVQAATELRMLNQQLEAEAKSTTAELSNVRQQLERVRNSSEARAAALEGEVQRQRDRADAATASLAAADARRDLQNTTGADALEKAQAEYSALKRHLEEVEVEVAQLRQSPNTTSLFSLPTKDDVLAGLGLEVWKDDRLRWKSSGDVEAATSALASGPSRVSPGLRAAGGALASSGRRIAGHVSLRVWLLVAYLSLLHIAVMVSFTHSSPDLTATLQACERLGTSGSGPASGVAVVEHGVLP